MRHNSAKLSTRHRFWVYATTTLIYLTGVAWAALHHFARSTDEFSPPSAAEPWILKLHGAAAMIILVLLGTLLPGHVRFAWHARRNRSNGIALVTSFAFLIVTGYGLYYFGNERARAWTSWLHLWVGIALPAMLLLHIWAGRRSTVAARPQRLEKRD